MRFLTLTFLLGTVLAMSGVCSARNTLQADCVSFAEASQHVGATQCVSGTVLHVENGSKGVTLLNFCKDAKACPFTVVVFPAISRRWATFASSKAGRLKSRERSRTTTDARRLSCAAPNSWAKPLSCYSPGCPRTTTWSARATISAGRVYARQGRQEDDDQAGRAGFDRRSGRATIDTAAAKALGIERLNRSGEPLRHPKPSAAQRTHWTCCATQKPKTVGCTLRRA